MPSRFNRILSFLTVFITLIIFSTISADETRKEAVQEIKKGTVTGRIMVKGKEDVSLSWGQIMFYNVKPGPPPMPEKYERTPDISRDIDAEGKFKVELPEGRYFIGAIKRLSGDRLGPPQVGDYVFRSLNEKNIPREYLVQAGKVLDVGTFAEAFQLTEEDLSKRRVTTALEGKIVNMEWKPVPDAIVVAFTEPIIGRKPLFVSNKSDKDGNYILPLTEGTYYLRVRNSFAAGPPEPGQIVGYYGEGTPAPVAVKKGEILTGIDFQVVVFRGRGPAPRPAPTKKKHKEPVSG